MRRCNKHAVEIKCCRVTSLKDAIKPASEKIKNKDRICASAGIIRLKISE